MNAADDKGIMEYLLKRGKSDLFIERCSVFANEIVVGELVQKRLTPTAALNGIFVWEGTIHGTQASVKIRQNSQTDIVVSDVQVGRSNVTFSGYVGHMAITMHLSGDSLSFQSQGGGYAVMRGDKKLGWWTPVWKDSETETGLLSRAACEPDQDRASVDALAIVLLFLYRFDWIAFG